MWIPLIGFIVSLTSLLSIIAVVRFAGRRRTEPRASGEAPSVTILKPLCGADDALEKNLETFFRQTHPRYELVFGVEGETDPAIPVVRRLRARYPDVAVRLVIHDGKRALNPKVSNLSAMLAWGSYDLVVISDSNVSVRPDWLARMVNEFASHPDNGLLTNLFVGTGEDSLGATLENLHLAGPVAGSIAVTNEFGESTAAVGKSMMFRRSTFESLGGFESVGSFLAEDYVMGRMFAEAGYRVRLAAVTVDNVCTHTKVSTFIKRHTRWGLLRSRLAPHL
jgi:ceramide glucosyltransferase